MPTLGQSNTSIYGDIQLPKPLNISGQPQSLGRASAGPTKGQLDFVAEQQKQQQIQALAQQYLADPNNPDYDGLVREVGKIDPGLSLEMGQKVSIYRKGQAENDIVQTQKARAFTKFGAQNLQYAVDHPEVLPMVKQMVEAVDPGLAKMVPDPSDPQYNDKMIDLIKKAQDTDNFLDYRTKAGQLYVDGKHDLAATLLAGSVTPQQRQVAEDLLKKGGTPDFAQMFPDAASAQAYLQKQNEINPSKSTEKGGQAKEGIYQGKRTFGVFDPNTNTFLVDGKQVSASEFRPIAPQSAGGGGGTASMSTPEIKPGTAWYRTAQDVAYGKLTFSQLRTLLAGMRGGTAAAQKIAFYDKAREINPNFNPAAFEMGYKYAGNPKTQNTLVSIDNALANFDKAVELSNALDRTDYPSVNKLLAAGKFQLGGKPVTNVQQFQTILGDDIALAIGQGAPSDYKTKLAQSLLNNNLSKDNLISTLKQAGEFLQNRKTAILRQEGPYGEKDFNPSANAPTPQVMGGGGNIPSAVASVLKTAGPGVHTLSDGSKWRVEVNGTITKAN